MKSKRCPECNKLNMESSKSCDNCYTDLSKVEAKENTVDDMARIRITSFCPECGEVMKKGTHNCSSCGAFIAKTSKVNVSRMSSGESYGSRNYSFTFIVSILIPLVGFICGAVFLTSDDYSKRDAGKTCILLGVLSMVISTIILAALEYIYV